MTNKNISILTPREKEIYQMRLEGLSLRSIGNCYKVSGERIRQIEQKILNKLFRLDHPSPYGNLSVRVVNSLVSAGIKSLKEAQKKDDYKLLSLKNIGLKSLLEIKNYEIRNILTP